MLDTSVGRRPDRIVTRTLGFGLGALVVAGLLTWTPQAASGWNQGSAEATLWQLLNGARTNNGMAPLQQHSTLIGLARWRSADMLAKDYFSHTIAGCGCLVYAYYDSNGLAYDWAGENIGWNSGLDDSYSPVRVHERFMASAGHRANVLDRRFTHGGVGAAAADGKMFQGSVQNTRMYTELFMQARAAAPAPAPAPAPPPSGGGSGGGGGGGGTGTRPAAQAPAQQAAPQATPEPKPKVVTVDTPARPRSSAGLDGSATVVTALERRPDLVVRHTLDERAAERAAQLAERVRADRVAADAQLASLEVATPEPPAPGPIEAIIGAVIGFLFG